MKKYYALIITLFIIAGLAGCAKTGTADEPVTGALTMPDYDGELSGKFAAAEDGTMILISGSELYVLNGEMNFDGLNTGDSLTVYYTAMTRSIPAQITVVEMTLAKRGTAADLTEDGTALITRYGFSIK